MRKPANSRTLSRAAGAHLHWRGFTRRFAPAMARSGRLVIRRWSVLVVACCLGAAADLATAGSPVVKASGSPQASAQEGDYALKPTLIAGGGGTMRGGLFELRGSVGQAAAATLGGADYRLQGGFWGAIGATRQDLIFKNGFDAVSQP